MCVRHCLRKLAGQRPFRPVREDHMPLSRFSFHLDYLRPDSEARKVFSDPKNTRHRKVDRFLVFVCVVAVGWCAFFLNGVVSGSTVVNDAWKYVVGNTPAPALHIYDHDHFDHATLQLATRTSQLNETDHCDPPSTPHFAAQAAPVGPLRVFAHAPLTPDWSHLSLEQSCETVDVVLPEWITISADNNAVKLADKDVRRPIESHLARADNSPALVPTVQLDLTGSDVDPVEHFSIKVVQEMVLHDLLHAVHKLNAQGACLDFGQLSDESLMQLKGFLDEFNDQFRRAELTSCIVLSAEGAAWREPSLTADFDYAVLKLFRQPWVGSTPAPLSPIQWFAAIASEAVTIIGHHKLVVALGNFAVDWETGVPIPQKLTYPEIMQKLSQADATIKFSSTSSNSFSTYRDSDGDLHKIWMLDAATAHNQLSILDRLGLTNVALWSLGFEDPGFWNAISPKSISLDELQLELALTRLDTYVHYTGEGPFLEVGSAPRTGFRHIEFDMATGQIENQSYKILPSPYVVNRYGKPEANQLVLTFDDGPDREYTSEILNTLEEYGVPAAFFVVGARVMESPDLVRRMIDEGHEIASHTFSHPRMDEVSASRQELEISLVNRLLAGEVGHETKLYREPYIRSGGPIDPERIASLELADSRQLINVGTEIVPRDWEGISAREITDYVIQQLEEGQGNVILLHDGGDDRSQSVAAVPLLITELRALGYEFVSLTEVLGIDRATLMPAIEGVAPVIDRISFSTVAIIQKSIEVIFWAVLFIGLTRTLSIFVLSLLRRRKSAPDSYRTPKVSVVIPAFNEEKVIAKCIERVRASDYENLEIIVVDDGSTDNTLNEVFEFKHKTDVRVVIQPNQGKWAAMNRAIMTVDSGIVVCIDADTQIKPDAIRKLARHFNDPKVGAVAGKIRVGNRVNLLTRLQALEYTTSQNLERKAFDAIRGILVVPGALGAWRVQALRRVGMFCEDTLTEDSDMTISVTRAGYRVIYEDRAEAYTEAPERIGQLLSQRLRWSLGMFQSAWKHQRAIFEGRSVGLVSIPDMFIFGYLFPLLAPIADLFILIVAYNYFTGGWGGEVSQAPKELWAFLLLPGLELLIAAASLMLDREERLWSLLLYPVQRLFYRPILYFSVIRSIARAISGRLAIWGNQKRKGRDYTLLIESQ